MVAKTPATEADLRTMRSLTRTEVLRGDGRLAAEELLPGFSCRVADLFL